MFTTRLRRSDKKPVDEDKDEDGEDSNGEDGREGGGRDKGGGGDKGGGRDKDGSGDDSEQGSRDGSGEQGSVHADGGEVHAPEDMGNNAPEDEDMGSVHADGGEVHAPEDEDTGREMHVAPKDHSEDLEDAGKGVPTSQAHPSCKLQAHPGHCQHPSGQPQANPSHCRHTLASCEATTFDKSMAVDVPLDLQGASRTIGGVLHGCALGNFLNHANKETNVIESGMSLLQGKVLFYTDRHEGVKPSMSLKHEVTPKLLMVLTKLVRSFSPSEVSLPIFISNLLLTILAEGNWCLYVWDDDVWAVKGWYETALSEDDPVAWEESMENWYFKFQR
jgi:hypothetical protein